METDIGGKVDKRKIMTAERVERLRHARASRLVKCIRRRQPRNMAELYSKLDEVVSLLKLWTAELGYSPFDTLEDPRSSDCGPAALS